jgi:hypothetical protein
MFHPNSYCETKSFAQIHIVSVNLSLEFILGEQSIVQSFKEIETQSYISECPGCRIREIAGIVGNQEFNETFMSSVLMRDVTFNHFPFESSGWRSLRTKSESKMIDRRKRVHYLLSDRLNVLAVWQQFPGTAMAIVFTSPHWFVALKDVSSLIFWSSLPLTNIAIKKSWTPNTIRYTSYSLISASGEAIPSLKAS